MDFEYIANILSRVGQAQGAVAEELNDNDVSLIKSERGNNMAVHRGFLFMGHSKNQRHTKQYWRCCFSDGRNGAKCNARLHTQIILDGHRFDKFVPHSIFVPHNHEIDPLAVPISHIKENIKQRAFSTREKPQQLINHELQHAPIAVAPSLSKSAIRKQVRRIRIKNQIPVVEGGRVQDIDIPTASRMYASITGGQELFLLGDSQHPREEDAERVLLFGRERHIDWSAEMKVVYMDGTFSITPTSFEQVYVILAERSAREDNGGKWVFPILYALLKNKSRGTYIKLFSMIKQIWPEFKPYSISVDFELAAIQALQEMFPESRVAGCFFHLMKNFKKTLSNNSLTVRYRDPEFSVQARMIMSLAFVPPTDVWRCFEMLEVYLPEELTPVLNWFKTYYVGNIMEPPMFPVNLWSCYDRTLAGEDRTNNFAEAANRRLQDALGVDHPTVGRLLEDLKKIQRTHDFNYEQYVAGKAAPKKRRIYMEADARILSKVHLYHQTSLLEYLRGLAHNFVMDQ